MYHSSLIFQDAAAQGCPVGVPGLQYVDDWRSWKAEEGDVQVQVKGEEERGKAWSRGKKLPRRRQADLPQRHQDQVLKHPGSVSWGSPKKITDSKDFLRVCNNGKLEKMKTPFGFKSPRGLLPQCEYKVWFAFSWSRLVIQVINHLNHFTWRLWTILAIRYFSG